MNLHLRKSGNLLLLLIMASTLACGEVEFGTIDKATNLDTPIVKPPVEPPVEPPVVEPPVIPPVIPPIEPPPVTPPPVEPPPVTPPPVEPPPVTPPPVEPPPVTPPPVEPPPVTPPPVEPPPVTPPPVEPPPVTPPPVEPPPVEPPRKVSQCYALRDSNENHVKEYLRQKGFGVEGSASHTTRFSWAQEGGKAGHQGLVEIYLKEIDKNCSYLFKTNGVTDDLYDPFYGSTHYNESYFISAIYEQSYASGSQCPKFEAPYREAVPVRSFQSAIDDGTLVINKDIFHIDDLATSIGRAMMRASCERNGKF